MKDRIPTYPGRVEVTHEDGTKELVTVKRADEPTQEGTALNKGNLLDDETVVDYGYSTAVEVTPNMILQKNLLLMNKGWSKLAQFTTAGSFVWTAPDLFHGASYVIGILAIGGGGAGGICLNASSQSISSLVALGGNSGSSNSAVRTVSPRASYNGVVGNGGVAQKYYVFNSITGNVGTNGGTTSFLGCSAIGGGGGTAYMAYSGQVVANNFRYLSNPGGGGQCAPIARISNYDNTVVYADGTPQNGLVFSMDGFTSGGNSAGCINFFEHTQMLSAGGCAILNKNGSITNTPSGVGAGAAKTLVNPSGEQTGNPATSAGCGGGALTVYGPNVYHKAGDGKAGCVYIYLMGRK